MVIHVQKIIDMKKIYISPNMKVIKSQRTHLLAGSGVNNGAPVHDIYDPDDVSY
jgi:hypothetical protein